MWELNTTQLARLRWEKISLSLRLLKLLKARCPIHNMRVKCPIHNMRVTKEMTLA